MKTNKYLVATPPSPCRINNAGTGYQKSRTGVIDYNYLTLIK